MGRDGAASATPPAPGGVRSWRCTSTAASSSGGCRASSSRSCAATGRAGSPCPAAVRRRSACHGGRSPDAGRARGRGGDGDGREGSGGRYARRGGGRRAPRGGAAGDPSRLTARVALLLEETAHQGLLALQLLVKARDLLARFAASDDEKVAALVVDLEQRLVAVEREGRERLRQTRRLLQGARGARA